MEYFVVIQNGDEAVRWDDMAGVVAETMQQQPI